jgi:hypothetical protein
LIVDNTLAFKVGATILTEKLKYIRLTILSVLALSEFKPNFYDFLFATYEWI